MGDNISNLSSRLNTKNIEYIKYVLLFVQLDILNLFPSIFG